MSRKLDNISEQICKKTTNLMSIISQKRKYLHEKKQEKLNFNNGGRLTALTDNFLQTVEDGEKNKIFYEFRAKAFNNIKCFNRVELDMSGLNHLKPDLIRELFNNDAGIDAKDFSSAQQKKYDWFTIKRYRYWLNFFDLISVFLFNFSIKEWLFPLPKTIME